MRYTCQNIFFSPPKNFINNLNVQFFFFKLINFFAQGWTSEVISFVSQWTKWWLRVIKSSSMNFFLVWLYEVWAVKERERKKKAKLKINNVTNAWIVRLRAFIFRCQFSRKSIRGPFFSLQSLECKHSSVKLRVRFRYVTSSVCCVWLWLK